MVHEEGSALASDDEAEIRVRVCSKQRRSDAESIGMELRRIEHELPFVRTHGGPAHQETARQLEVELAELKRIEQLLLTSPDATRYVPEDDPLFVAAVESEREREQAAADAQFAAQQSEAERRDRALRRAEDLLDLVGARKLDSSVPVCADDPEAWRMLRGRSPAAVAQLDAWMAQALAARTGAFADDGVRAAAYDTLPARVTAHAALLTALGSSGDLPFVGVLARSAPEAAAQLAEWLAAEAPSLTTGP